MKVGDTGLDDLLNEAQFVLRDDGRRRALVLLWSLTWAYRRTRSIMLAALRLPWRRPEPELPDIGNLPFAPSDRELERAWREQ